MMVPWQVGYFGKGSHAEQGVQQRDIISPLVIFNIMVDVVLRYWQDLKGGRTGNSSFLYR